MIKTIKQITIKTIEKIKANPTKMKFLLVLIYPILPLAILAIYFLAMLFGKILLTNTSHIDSLEQTFYFALAIIWFLGGPAGLLGGLLILFNKISKTSIALFVYGSISYSIIAGAYIYLGFIRFFIGSNYWIGLHSLYLLFTFWIIGKQLLGFYKNRQKEVLA